MADSWTPVSVTCSQASTTESYTYTSAIPADLLVPCGGVGTCESEVVMGIDEAGRGPVLGPMVYGVAFYRRSGVEAAVKEAGFMDSKVLSHETRVSLVKRMTSGCEDDVLAGSVGWSVRVMSARDISSGMLRPRMPVNLNTQAFEATCMLVRGVLEAGVQVTHVYVDTVGPPESYEARLSREFPTLVWKVAKKADALYPCVSAASVVAKVTRDYALARAFAEMTKTASRPASELAAASAPTPELLKAESAVLATEIPEGEEDLVLRSPGGGAVIETVEKAEEMAGWGSGYPGDPATKAFLIGNKDKVFGWPMTGTVRYAWATARDMLQPPGSSSNAGTKRSRGAAVGGRKAASGGQDEIVTIDWFDEVDDDEEANDSQQQSLSSYFGGSETSAAEDPAGSTDAVFDIYKTVGRSVGVAAF
ncbi:hypothetical protein PYCC9005_003133 [Savitreella phatthalungensis]